MCIRDRALIFACLRPEKAILGLILENTDDDDDEYLSTASRHFGNQKFEFCVP